MKTVITDNSLCTLPIDERAKPEHIFKYIQALAETGVKYVEIDFRTVMKMQELPEGIGYIFRLGDPMFKELTAVFDFSYVLVTIQDLKERVSIGHTPVIMEFPAIRGLSRQLLRLAQGQISGPISMVRLRGSYPVMEPEAVGKMVWQAKNSVTVPIDLCPMNAKKAALDTAIKASRAGIDSLTMCMGRAKNYASIEDYLFALMTIHDVLPKEFSLSALCKAEIYHRLVFGERSTDCITDIMKLIDYDIQNLINADTGEQVKMRVTLKDKMLLRHTYVTALQKFAEEEDIPEDIAADFFDAIAHYDSNCFNPELLRNDKLDLLN
ncbi:MAG: hypothetical protein J6A19_07020 [Oscillospiraceae bacterium]|nr:hypothetical protein [Oscillospiraceae bacterium]